MRTGLAERRRRWRERPEADEELLAWGVILGAAGCPPVRSP